MAQALNPRSLERFDTMHHTVSSAALLLVFGAAALACTAEAEGPVDETDEILENLQIAGFPDSAIELRDDGAVFVEGDVEVTLEASREMAGIIGDSGVGFRQYRETNVVSRNLLTICVDGSVLTGAMDTALDRAIEQYQSIDLTFDLVRDDNPTFGCSAVITAETTPGTTSSAGFPSGGIPFPTITLATGTVANTGFESMVAVTMHEIGHCLGLRHSDWFDRTISCNPPEDREPPATLIPDTPAGAVLGGSIMNACHSSASVGAWTETDRIALDAIWGYDTDDLLLRMVPGNVRYWRMNSGDALKRRDVSGPVHGSWSLVGAGDVDGDGTDDIIWQHNNGQVHYWPMTTGVAAPGIDIGGPVSSQWTFAALGDIDGDATDDIIWRHSDGRVHYWKMSAGSLVGGFDVSGSVAASWTLEAAGNMDGDGTDDIVWRNTNGQVHYWPMRLGARDGTGVNISSPVSSAWTLIDTGDLNGDGTDDIVWRSSAGQMHYWAIRDGAKAGAFDIDVHSSDAFRVQAVGDVDAGPL